MRTALIACFVLVWSFSCQAAEIAKPNFVVILADDLGYSDLGCYGSEIDTPNLDRLAEAGVRFTQFYNTGRCWPTRAALMTGYYAPQVGRDKLPGEPKLVTGNRTTWAKLLPERLAPLGYKSYHSGKWHIDSSPVASGFFRSYQLEDHDRYFYPQHVRVDDKRVARVERGTNYYTTTAIADRAIEHLKHHAATSPDAPFMSYVAFLAPHFPLHAPERDIAKYRDRYQVGWDRVRGERYAKQRELNLIDCELSDPEQEVGPPYDFPKALDTLGPGEVNRPLPWDQLTAEQQEFQAAKMAVHAAMVDHIDQQVGQIIAQLKDMGAFENTVIMFLSDNGASAEIMVRGDGHDPAAPPGSAGSYLCLGPGWSNCSNTPFRRHKTWVHEGGIATPMIVHWPAGIENGGELLTTPAHVVDVVPTLLELAGADDFKPEVPWEGMSLASLLAGDSAAEQAMKSRTIWWLHEGNRAMRRGDMKLVADNDDKDWSLYDMSVDRDESTDLSTGEVEMSEELAEEWQSYVDRFRQKLENSQRIGEKSSR